MKPALTISILLLLLISCRQKGFQESIDDIRNDFSKQAEEYNTRILSWETRIDSIIKIADTNQILSIHYIDNLLKSDTALGTLKILDLHFLKGNIYYQIDSFNKALDEFSIVEQMDFIDTNPKLLAAKAGAHIKLKEYDLALNELRQATEINYDYYWNIGNYFEIRRQTDSAITNYQKLYDKDTTFYKYCKDRIAELKLNKSNLLTELVYRDRERKFILMHGVK